MSIRIKILTSALASLLLIAGAMMFYAHSGDERIGSQITREATNYLKVVDMDRRGVDIENHGDGQHIWSMRENASEELFNPAIVEATQFLQDSPVIMADSLKKEPVLYQDIGPLLALEGLPKIFAPLMPAHEYVDKSQPVHWRLPKNLFANSSPVKDALSESKQNSAPLVLAHLAPSGSAENYRELVNSFANRYNLSAELVMAIIHSESDFSPTLVSNKSAMGLMQLLPSTASDEVHRFLYGHRGQVSFNELRVPEINIRYGTAYLHILLNRYFSNVRNSEVRENCVIASYNLGPNRFLRLYGPTNELAVEKINSMSAEEFHRDLPNRLPARETRYFVEKVRRMKQRYTSLQ